MYVVLCLPKVFLGPAATQKTRQAPDVECAWMLSLCCDGLQLEDGSCAQSWLQTLVTGNHKQNYEMAHYSHDLQL